MKIDTYRSVNAEKSGLVNERIRLESDEGTVEVTIGICVRNGERTIKETLASVLNQTFPHGRMEIIVVDDGSTDRTLQIVTELLSRTDIQVQIYSTNGEGLGTARQMVVDNCRGRYIIWVDGDMILSNDFVQENVNLMSKNPTVGVCGAKLKNKLSGSAVAKLEVLSYIREFEMKVNRKDIKRTGTGGSIFRVAALKKVGGFDRKIRGAAEDADVTARIKSAGYSLVLGQAELEHKFTQTWKGTWNHSAWYGYGIHFLYHKNKHLVDFRIYFFPISFAMGIIRLIMAFKATHKWICFLLPFFYLFKTVAWWYGFFKAHIENYGHRT